AVEGACIDYSIKRRRVADSGKAEKPNRALLPQPLKCRHDLTKDLLDAEGFAATDLGNRIVKMEDVDPVTPQSYQAVFERCRHGIGNVAETGVRQPHFRADDYVRRLQLVLYAGEIVFRFTVAVLYRGVEIVHTGANGPRNGSLLIERIAAHHQSADRTATEAKQ